MGCCLSTKNTNKEENNSLSSSPKNNTISKAPPSSYHALEDETIVKEVLSETPIAIFSQDEPTKEPLMHCSPDAKLLQNEALLKEQEDVVSNKKFPPFEEPKVAAGCNKKLPPFEELKVADCKKKLPPFEELSEEASESCVSTTTETKNFADDDNDVTQTRHQSPAKNRSRQVPGNRVGCGQPGRVRSDPSPGRVRPGVVRDGRGQNRNGVRRGPVMGSDRRSMSPVTRVDGGGTRAGLSRCPSGRRTGKSPGRFGPPELAEKNSKFEQPDPELDPTNEESLENPLVSLECFIFL